MTQGRSFKVGMRPAVWVSNDRNPFTVQLELAQAAEQMGFDGVFFGDRFLSQAAVQSGDTIYGSTHTELLTTLTSIATVTSRVAVGSLVLVVPFRHPVMLAKQLASLDLLADGRLILPVGGGWNRQEFEVLGLHPNEIGGRLEESLEIMQALWRGGRVTYHGRYFDFTDVAIEPLPVQSGGPPIWFGSFTPDTAPAFSERGEVTERMKRICRRIARFGDGWVPMTYSVATRRTLEPEILGRLWDTIREYSAEQGRNREAITFALQHWLYVIQNRRDEEEARRHLSGFFPGTFGEARNTYLIGSPEEIAAKLQHLTSALDRVDWYIFTLLGTNERQLDLVWNEVVPRLGQ